MSLKMKFLQILYLVQICLSLPTIVDDAKKRVGGALCNAVVGGAPEASVGGAVAENAAQIASGAPDPCSAVIDNPDPFKKAAKDIGGKIKDAAEKIGHFFGRGPEDAPGN